MSSLLLKLWNTCVEASDGFLLFVTEKMSNQIASQVIHFSRLPEDFLFRMIILFLVGGKHM